MGAQQAKRRAQREERDRAYLLEKELLTSVAAKRLQQAARGDAVAAAAELRYREVASSLSSPGWIAGAQQCHGTYLYKEARKAAAHAQQQMAETARLNIGLEEFLPDDLTDCGLLRSRRLALPLRGGGSVSYRIGRQGEELQHARDLRVASLEALKKQRKKKWWKK